VAPLASTLGLEPPEVQMLRVRHNHRHSVMTKGLDASSRPAGLRSRGMMANDESGVHDEW
jgi:hypothetical protein